MAILFIDGAELYHTTDNSSIATHIGRKWGTVVNSVKLTTSGRFGGQGFWLETTQPVFDREMSSVRKNLGANYSTLVLNTALKWKTGGGLGNTDNRIIQFLDSAGSVQITVTCDSDTNLATLKVYRGDKTTELLSISTGVTTAWCYFEIKIIVANSGGSISVKIDGTSKGSYSGDTQETANANIREFLFCTGKSSGTVDGSTGDYRELYYDDVVVSEDFITEASYSTIKRLAPTADGGVDGQWTLSSGTDAYALVDERPPNDDTDYIEGATVGDRQTFGMADLATGANAIVGPIHCIALNSVNRNTGGTNTLKHMVRLASTNYDAAGSWSPGATYEHRQDILETNPNSSAAWTVTNCNDLEAGVKWHA